MQDSKKKLRQRTPMQIFEYVDITDVRPIINLMPHLPGAGEIQALHHQPVQLTHA